MLTLSFELNPDKLQKAYETLSLNEAVSGANFLFFDETDVVGLMRTAIVGTTVVVNKVVFLNGVEDGDKEFFVRSMFFKFINAAPAVIAFHGEHKELESFGFVFDGEYMKILSSNINLHNCCQGGNK